MALPILLKRRYVEETGYHWEKIYSAVLGGLADNIDTIAGFKYLENDTKQ